MVYTLNCCYNTDGLLTLAHNVQNPGDTALQAANGFRQYASDQANMLGVTGYIRYTHKHVQMLMQGTADQLQQFTVWLHICAQQGMCTPIEIKRVPVQIPHRSYNSFDVQSNEIRPYHRDAHPDGVVRGSNRDKLVEKPSMRSSSGRGGSSNQQSSSGGICGAGGSSSYGFAKKGSGTGGKSSSTLTSAGQTAIGAEKRARPARVGGEEEGR
jgi:acylphosphatase